MNTFSDSHSYVGKLQFHKNTDTVLNLSYLAIKLPNVKSVDEKLPEVEPRMSHSFVLKIVSRKKLLKVLAPPQTHFRWDFSVSKSRCVYKISQWFFRYFKALLLIYPYGLKISFWPFPSVSNWTVTLTDLTVCCNFPKKNISFLFLEHQENVCAE